MRISQLSKLVDVPSDTLRYYERQGLLSAPKRNSAGYRTYDQSHVAQLQFIKRAKSVGFSLGEITELLAIRVEKAQHSCTEVKELTLKKRQQVADKIAQLERFYLSLSVLAERCSGSQASAQTCTILSALEDVDAIVD